MDDIIQVVWREKDAANYGLRDEAIRAELMSLPPGDTLTVCQEDCAVRMGAPCDCVPDVFYGPPTNKHQ